MESSSNQNISLNQIKKYFIFEILQSSHPFPWWQLCTLLAFSQPASWGSHLECISINWCALLKVHFVEFLSFLMCLRQLVVLWPGRGGCLYYSLWYAIWFLLRLWTCHCNLKRSSMMSPLPLTLSNVVLLFLLTWPKYFDTVDHSIIVGRLRSIGVQGVFGLVC